jgi:hypothetical protein
MQIARGHPYLENERLIPRTLLESPRFVGRIRNDGHGNAIFPHFDQAGLCGYEIKNRHRKHFAAGGSKGLWVTHTRSDDSCLVLCESAIDALSYAALFPDPRARYASVAGEASGAQEVLIQAAIIRMPCNAQITAAMDNDADGRDHAGVVRSAFDAAGRADLSFRDHVPDGFKDWNEQLCGGNRVGASG